MVAPGTGRHFALAVLCAAACLYGSIARGAEPPISDDRISAELKSSLRLTGWIDASRLSVVTSKGVVYLSGVAADATERALAIELARNVRGVRAVDSSGLQP